MKTISFKLFVAAIALAATASIFSACKKDNPAPVDLSLPIPEVVDLGLSVKWANFNLGASKPEEVGYYYAYGELEPKDDYSWETYRFGPREALTKYNAEDGKTSLLPEDDAAAVKLGGDWRMPTDSELNELFSDKVHSEPFTINGVKGTLVTSKVAGFLGNWIFIPDSGTINNKITTADNWGYLRSSTLDPGNKVYAKYIYAYGHSEPDTEKRIYVGSHERRYGMPIRPVCSK